MQEHDQSVKECESKSALSQHHVMTEHKVLSKPTIERVSVIDSEPRKLYRKVKEVIHINLRRAPSTELESMTYLTSTYLC